MDVVSIDAILTATGHGNLVPLVAAAVTVGTALIGFFSVLSTVYPPTWKGAATIHKIALLVGKAKPATPATPTASK